jgi:RNA-directed DNA polymerase
MLPAKLMEEIASDEVIDEAYRWLCRRRGGYSHNNDVWTLRWFWDQIKPGLQAELLAGSYRFESLHLIPDSPDHVALWTSRDSLVQKAMAIVLTRHLAPLLPSSCYHLIGNGGSKGALRTVLRHLPGNAYVFRTDVKNYYAAIDHDILHSQLKEQIGDSRVLDLLLQYMRRTIYDGGLYTDVTRGIPMGCPLSPLMGAIYLKPLDDRMAPLTCGERGRTNVFYVRFMDDWVVMAPTRWKLRAAVRTVNETMAQLKMEQHPDKTFVGRISRGFDFLGYRISPAGLIGLAAQSVQQTVERINRLYEQGANDLRIGQYVRRWWAWVRGGMLRACRGGDCLEFPQQLLLSGVLPVTLTEAMRNNGVLYLSGDLPAAAQGQTTEGDGGQAQAGRFGDVRAGPGVGDLVFPPGE